MTYLQPMEGVLGVLGKDRTGDDLLSLEMSAYPHRELVKGLAFHLHSATLVGNAPPKVQRMFDRIKKPVVGDYVVELTSRFRADVDLRTKAFGVLLEHRKEWWDTDEDWEKVKDQYDLAGGEQRPVDEAWYVQYGQDPGDICRWTNCMFITVPVPDEQFSEPAADGSGWITRDSLLGTLADSGFQLRKP